MIIIGVCGSSGSGKSTVCRFLEEKGLPVFNCDKEYSFLITPPSACLNEIKEHFGPSCLLSDGTLNRSYLSALIFNDHQKRNELNQITFSHITKTLLNRIEQEKESADAFVIDAPLLFESKLNELCDVVIGVISSFENKLCRLSQRDRQSIDILRKRIEAQKSDAFLKEQCDYIIENNETEEKLKGRVERLLFQIFRSKTQDSQ